MKNHHISEAGVSSEIQFGLWIKIWAGEYIFYIRQQTSALKIVFRILKLVVKNAVSLQNLGPFSGSSKNYVQTACEIHNLNMGFVV